MVSRSVLSDHISGHSGHSGNIYPTEIGKHYKPSLNFLFCCLSRLEKVMEKMLIMQIKLNCVSPLEPWCCKWHKTVKKCEVFKNYYLILQSHSYDWWIYMSYFIFVLLFNANKISINTHEPLFINCNNRLVVNTKVQGKKLRKAFSDNG